MWRKVYGFDDYLCNEQGEIYSLKRNRILKGRSMKGYRRVVLMKNGKQIDALVHRLIAQTFIPNPKNKPEVNHKDGNKENNSVFNLEWCTQKENVHHAMKTGLKNDRKVSNEKLNEIRRLISEGKGNTEIEKITGIPRKTVSNIRIGKCYKENEREVN